LKTGHCLSLSLIILLWFLFQIIASLRSRLISRIPPYDIALIIDIDIICYIWQIAAPGLCNRDYKYSKYSKYNLRGDSHACVCVFNQHGHTLCLDGALLHALLALFLTLLIEELALLVSAQAAELGVALLLLELVGGQLALLGLLLLFDAADLGNLLVARLADAAQRLGAEVRYRRKVVRQPQEVVEDGERRRVVRLQLERKVDALAGLGLVEAGL
jgi:hypothetical protein